MTDIDNELKTIYKNMLNLNTIINNNNNDIILLQDIKFYKNLSISGNTTINNVTLNSSLNIIGNINVNNIYINTNIYANKYINNNKMVVANNLYLTGSSIINKLTTNSNLNILGFAMMNTVQTTLLHISSNTVLLNITSNSNINVIQNITSMSNISINNNLYISNNTILNNVTVISSLYVSNITYINLPISITSNLYNFGKLVTTNMTISSNLNIVGDISINNIGTFNNITIGSNITINNVLTVKNIYTNSIILNSLADYDTNTLAIENKLSSWEYYRTGDILKIVVDNSPPYITNKTINNILKKGDKYTEIGINMYDNMSNVIDMTLFITSIVNNSVNYLSNKIQITTTTIINEFNSLLLGNHVITYTAYDKEKNYSTINKTVSVILDTVPPTITLLGDSIIKVKLNEPYIEQGATVINDVVLVISGIVNTSTIGKYIITYTATNLSNKTTVLIRIVYVLNKSIISPFNFIDLELNDPIIINSATNIITNGLVFYLKVSNMNTLNNSWFDTNNQYEFIPHTIANKYTSITKIQNNNGWSRSDSAGWVLKDNTILLSKDWTNGLTLEQWIYVDYNYAASTTKMLLVGQGSLYSTYDYGLCLNQTLYPYTTYEYNILSFATNTVIKKEGNGLGYINLNDIRGKWVNISVTVSTTTATGNKTLNIYLNGLLRTSLSQTQWLNNWPNVPLNTNKFTIGCDNNGLVQTESLNTIFFGDTLLYNRMLYSDEILNNYNYNKNKYLTPIINKVNYTTRIPTYNLFTGYMSQYQIDLNNLKTSSWTVEVWIYIKLRMSPTINILNINNNYLIFGVNIQGNPYILYNSILIIENSSYVAQNQWTHIVYQKNSDTEFVIFVNGISYNKLPITNLSLKFPTFGNLDLNNLTIGNNSNYWSMLISQLKISYVKLYNTNFTPVIDTILDYTTIFLLDDNFINIASNKSLINYDSVIDDVNNPNIPTLVLQGENPIILYKGISNYVEYGVTIDTTLRINIPSVVIQNNVNTNISNVYINVYTITGLDYTSYIIRTIKVINYNIRPIITLNGSSVIYLIPGSIYIEQGVTITNNISEVILPVISGNINVNIIGKYVLQYKATDSYNNWSVINRTIIVIDLPINDINFWIDASIIDNINLRPGDTIISIKDITKNNITLDPFIGAASLIYNHINTLPVFDLTTASLKSINSFPNSNDITFAIIVEHQDITSSGCVWGHFNNPITDLLLNTNLNKCILISNNNSVQLEYSSNVPVMYIGTLSEGVVIYLKMVNLITGVEIFDTITIDTPSLVLGNCNIYLGSSDVQRSNEIQKSKCYIGELLYWKKILNDVEIAKIQAYLYNKWHVIN